MLREMNKAVLAFQQQVPPQVSHPVTRRLSPIGESFSSTPPEADSTKQQPKVCLFHKAQCLRSKQLFRWSRNSPTFMKHDQSLFSAKLIQSTTSHPISLESILIVFFHLCISLSSVLFPSGFLNKIWNIFLFSSMCTTCLIHLIRPDLINLIISDGNYTNYETPQNAIFSILLLFPPLELHIYSSAPCFQTSPVCLHPLM